MRYWLLKTEPESFSIDDFAKEGETLWTGVRNYQARNLMRDDMAPGDKVIIYHSSANPSGAAGVGEILGDKVSDPTQLDPKSPYFDEKATKAKPVWFCRKVLFKRKFKRLIALAELKADPRLKGIPVAATGNRLSVQPLTKEHFFRIVSLGS